MLRVLKARKFLPFLALLFLFSRCSDVKGIKERYLIEKMFYRANKLYQNIQITPRSVSPASYRQVRESFRQILVKHPVASLQAEGRFPEETRRELLVLIGTSQMNVADLFFQEGQIDSAIVGYQKVVADYAGNRALGSRAQYYIALGFKSLGRWEDAVSAFEVLLQDYTPFVETPEQPDVNILQVPASIAQAYQLQGEQAEADRHYEKAREYLWGVVRKWPHTLTAQFAQNQIVVTYLGQERWQEAIANLETLLTVHSDSIEPPEASLTIAALYGERLHELSKAMEIYSGIVEEYPDSKRLSRVHLAMGNIHLQRGELTKSREEFNRVIIDFPEDAAAGARAQYSIALAYEMEGAWDKALNEFRWIMENYPDSPEALQVPDHILEHYLQFSEEGLAASAYTQALKDYAKFTAKDPNSAQAVLGQWYIIRCHIRMEKWSEALAALETFVVNYPQSPQVQLALLRIGEIYEINLDQPAEALGAYQRLVEKFPRGQPSQIALQRIEILKQKTE